MTLSDNIIQNGKEKCHLFGPVHASFYINKCDYKWGVQIWETYKTT